MSNWVDQAREAVTENNWAQLVECLQEQVQRQPIAEMTEAEIAALIDFGLSVLELGDFQERWEIAKVFPVLGGAMIAPLTALIHNEQAPVESRWFAARILGSLNDSTAIQVLATLLQEEDEELSAIAADALANLGAVTIPVLASLLEQEDTRFLAVQVLAQIHHSDVISPLMTVLQDPQPATRILAIEALRMFPSPHIATALVPALKDPVASVRRAAISSLGSYPNLATELSLVDRLAESLWDINLGVCQQAALALGRLGLDTGIPPLVRVLRSPHSPAALQRDSIRALGWIGSRTALMALQNLLLDNSSDYPIEVYQDMVETLGHWPDPTLQALATQGLLESLSSVNLIQNHPQLRQAIALLLGHLKQPQALDPLIQLLADQDDRVRLHAIAALKTLDAPTAYERLIGLQASQDVPQDLRQGVAIALQEW
jgi:HEAT repeat protein